MIIGINDIDMTLRISSWTGADRSAVELMTVLLRLYHDLVKLIEIQSNIVSLLNCMPDELIQS